MQIIYSTLISEVTCDRRLPVLQIHTYYPRVIKQGIRYYAGELGGKRESHSIKTNQVHFKKIFLFITGDRPLLDFE